MDSLEKIRDVMEQQGFSSGEIVLVLSAYQAFNSYLEDLGLNEVSSSYRSPLGEQSSTPCIAVSYAAHLRQVTIHITKEARGLVLVAKDEYGISGTTLRSRMLLTLNTKPQDLRALFRELLSRDLEQHMG